MPTPTATPDLGLILPDIQATDSDDIFITVNAGMRFLHFSTGVHNVGEGSLQLAGETPENAEATTAWQIIETRMAGEFERNVGVLQMNDSHGHWHLDDFATYELWTHHDDGELDTLVASSGKVTFCLIDEFPIEPDTYGDGPRFGPCDPYVQGISPGWGETYEAWLPGQSLDITDLPDGGYALLTTLDPSSLLLEADTSNNVHVMYIVIEGAIVEPAAPLAEDESGVDMADGEPPL